MKKQRTQALLGALILAGSLLAGCASGAQQTESESAMSPEQEVSAEEMSPEQEETASANAPLMDELVGVWTVVSATGSDGPMTEIPPAEMSIGANGRMGFNSGCNSVGGPVSVEDGQIVFGDAFMTLMFCEGPTGELEGIVTTLMAEPGSASLSEDGELILADDDGMSVVFQKNPPVTLEDLVGTWTLTTILPGNESVFSEGELPMEEVPPATLVIAEDGSFDFDSGCNTNTGTLSEVDGQMVFGPVMQTRMFCEGPEGEAETLVVSAMTDQQSLFITSTDTLSLVGGEDLSVSFTKE